MIVIEIEPLNTTDHNLHILLSHEKIPTYKSFDYIAKVADLPKNETLPDFKFHYWFINSSLVLNQTGGRWFMNVVNIKKDDLLTDVKLLERKTILTIFFRMKGRTNLLLRLS